MTNPVKHPPVHAILLAAGQGKRLGYPKALLRWQGHWMLPRLVRALRAGGASSVTVVTRAELESEFSAREPLGDCHIVFNPDPERGRTSSIQCAAVDLPPKESLLIHPCDIPLLSADAVTTLLLAWAKEENREQLFARLVTPAGKGGHPLIVGAKHVEALLALDADAPLRDLMHAHNHCRLDVIRRSDPGPFLDVNTPEQLAFMESLLS